MLSLVSRSQTILLHIRTASFPGSVTFRRNPSSSNDNFVEQHFRRMTIPSNGRFVEATFELLEIGMRFPTLISSAEGAEDSVAKFQCNPADKRYGLIPPTPGSGFQVLVNLVPMLEQNKKRCERLLSSRSLFHYSG